MESSGEEDSQQFHEALDPQFTHNSTRKNTKEHKQTKPPSLRPKRDEDEQFNLLGVTPQFQEYVAKRLSSILDRHLEKRLVYMNSDIVKRKTKNRVKLFRNSDKYLKPHKEEKVRRPQCETDSDDDTKFSEAAVDPSELINKTEITNWSKKTKGKVFRYQSDTNGTLSLID